MLCKKAESRSNKPFQIFERLLLSASSIVYINPFTHPEFKFFRETSLLQTHLYPQYISIIQTNHHFKILNTLPIIMKFFYAIIPFLSIAIASPGATVNGKLIPADLEKRSTCSSDGGKCVNTNNGNSCVGGFLIEGLCPGTNADICCFTAPGDSVCIDCTC